MEVKIIPPADRRDNCQPITCTRPLAEVPVANRRLEDLSRQRILSAITPAADSKMILYVFNDCWLSLELLNSLKRCEKPVTVKDQEGETIAWTQFKEQPAAVCPRPGSNSIMEADADSFRIRFPWHLLRINEIVIGAMDKSVIAGEVSPASHFEGVVDIGINTRILPGVFIEGNAVIGANCKIGPNCYIRGNTAIGDNCHIGQAVEVKNSLIMNHVSLGHLSYCGDSIIGEKVNFGAGTITANLRHDGCSQHSLVEGELVDTLRRKLGTVVGDEVHTGIHTSIYPGRKIWPRAATRPGAVVKRDINE